MRTMKEARGLLGWSMMRMANELGIPYRTVQDWEAGRRKCPDYVERLIVEKLERIHAELGVESPANS